MASLERYGKRIRSIRKGPLYFLNEFVPKLNENLSRGREVVRTTRSSSPDYSVVNINHKFSHFFIVHTALQHVFFTTHPPCCISRANTRAFAAAATAATPADSASSSITEVPDSERALRDLFVEGMKGGAWGDEDDVDVKKGSELATALVVKQCATSVANSAKALMEHPQWLIGLVFILVEECTGTTYHVVWQITEFKEATQMVVAKRVSVHERREIAEKTSFPLSMV